MNFIRISFVLTFVFAYTQVCVFAVPEPDTALQELFELRTQQGALSVPFTHKRYSTLFRQPQTRTGTFHFDGEETAALHYTVPREYTFLIKDGKAWHFRPEDPSPKPLSLRADPLMGGLAHLFRLDTKKLERMFTIETVSVSNNTIIALRMIPRRDAPIKQIQLQVDRTSGLLKQLRIDETNGDSQTIQFQPATSTLPSPEFFSPSFWQQKYAEEPEP